MAFWGNFPKQNAQMYTLRNGLVYTARYATPLETERVPSVVLLSLSDEPLTIRAGTESICARAVLIRSKAKRRIDVTHTPFTTVHIDPSHPLFRSLQHKIGSSLIQKMDHEAFAPALEGLRSCHQGAASLADAQNAFDAVIDILTQELSLNCQMDPRISVVLQRLSQQSPIDYVFKDILRLSGLSPGRFSRLFTEQAGVSLRTYQAWRKVMEALRLLTTDESLTGVAHGSGFSDSAHFSRTFANTFGLVPSLFRSDRCIQVIA